MATRAHSLVFLVFVYHLCIVDSRSSGSSSTHTAPHARRLSGERKLDTDGFVYLADNTTSTTTGGVTGRPVLQVNTRDSYQVCDDIGQPTFSAAAAQVICHELGYKNGTFQQGGIITAPWALTQVSCRGREAYLYRCAGAFLRLSRRCTSLQVTCTGTRTPNNTQLALGLGLSLGLVGILLLSVLIWSCKRYWAAKQEADTRRRAAVIAAELSADTKRKSLHHVRSSSPGVTSHKSSQSTRSTAAGTAAAGPHGQAEGDWTVRSGTSNVPGARGSAAGSLHSAQHKGSCSQAAQAEQVDVQVAGASLNGPSGGRKLRADANASMSKV